MLEVKPSGLSVRGWKKLREGGLPVIVAGIYS